MFKRRYFYSITLHAYGSAPNSAIAGAAMHRSGIVTTRRDPERALDKLHVDLAEPGHYVLVHSFNRI